MRTDKRLIQISISKDIWNPMIHSHDNSSFKQPIRAQSPTNQKPTLCGGPGPPTLSRASGCFRHNTRNNMLFVPSKPGAYLSASRAAGSPWANRGIGALLEKFKLAFFQILGHRWNRGEFLYLLSNYCCSPTRSG
jgi:hypothetical protein